MSVYLNPRAKKLMFWGRSSPARWEGHAAAVNAAIRKKVIAALKKGTKTKAGRPVVCKLCDTMLSNGERTGHGYVWNDKVEHYITKHKVWVPELFDFADSLRGSSRSSSTKSKKTQTKNKYVTARASRRKNWPVSAPARAPRKTAWKWHMESHGKLGRLLVGKKNSYLIEIYLPKDEYLVRSAKYTAQGVDRALRLGRHDFDSREELEERAEEFMADHVESPMDHLVSGLMS
jgi:hypothetical protein